MKEIIIKALAEGKDPHKEVAKVMFNTENPTEEQRRIAKQHNFKWMYNND